MRVLCYSDLHIRDYSSYSSFNRIDEKTGLTYELLNIQYGMKFIIDMIIKHKPEMVVNLGDTFNSPEYISSKSITLAQKMVEEMKLTCSSVGAYHVCIEGNHDIYNSEHKIASSKLLRAYYDKYIDEPTKDFVYSEDVGFIPYIDDQQKFYQAMLDMSSQVGLIFTHYNFAGCKFENGMPSASKMNSTWGIPVIAGDIHLPQEINDVIYVGSNIQNRFSSSKLFKCGCMLYDTKTKETTRLFNTYSKHYIVLNSLDEKLINLYKKYKNNVILHVYLPEDQFNKAIEKLEGFEYKLLKQIISDNDNNDIYDCSQSFDVIPEKVLSYYVQQNKLEAVDTLDRIMKL